MTKIPTQTEAQVAHRFRYAADILEGMSDGIDGHRLGALTRWALHGQVAPDEQQDLINIFAAPHIAAIEEAAWDGEPMAEAVKDIARITAEAEALRTPSRALVDIAHERARQISAEGWTPDHDDEHDSGELARAGGLYAYHAGSKAGWPEATYRSSSPPFYDPVAGREPWPWYPDTWKPKDPRRDLVRAGALIMAEIERLDRADERGAA